MNVTQLVKIMKLAKVVKLGMIVAIATTMLGCSAVTTAVKKQDLVVESYISHAVTLEPVSPDERVIYTRVKDVSGNQMRKEMQRIMEANLKNEGFVITRDPKKANLMLDATILRSNKSTSDDSNAYLSQGYKGGAEGALTGATVAAIAGGSGKTTAGAALAGAAVGFLADTLVDDVYYTFVMDIELRERPLEGDSITNTQRNKSASGFNGGHKQVSNKRGSNVVRGSNFNWIVHQTRIVTTANKMNLTIDEAIPAVQKRTANSLAEMML